MTTSDLRHAFRSLARTPWYTSTVVGVIALAMALTTSVLAVVDGVLFKPLPYRDPERLFAVSAGFSKLPGDNRPMRWTVSPLELNAWRAALPGVGFTAFSTSLYETDTLDTVLIPYVDSGFFDTLGVALQGGRFAPGDFHTRASVPPVVITHALWQSRFALEPSAIGRTLVDQDGATKRVVAILPAGFVFPNGPYATETVMPLIGADPGSRTRNLFVVARVPAGLSARQVGERLTAATRRLAATWPPLAPMPEASERTRILRGPHDTVRLDPLRDALAARSIQTARIVFWAAAALMLLACLNVGGLAVARVQDRHRDLVVRRALGARYTDLARLLATESVVVAAAGAVLGVCGARALLAATTTLMPRTMQFLKAPVVDGRVLALSALATTLTVLLITLLPARVAWTSGLQSSLAGGWTATPRVPRGGWSIVSGQVALALVMAVGGALVAGSLVRVWGEDVGFNVDRVAVLTVSSRRSPAAAIEDLMATIRHLPGVKSVGGIDHPLLEHAFNGNSFDRPAGVVIRQEGPSDAIEEIGVTSYYLQAAGLRPTDGRLPTEVECADGAPVIVVSDRVAREYWPGKRAVGQSLMNNGRLFTVIGVVPDARYLSLDMDPQGAIYWSVAATPQPYVSHVLVTFDRVGSARLHDLVAAFEKRCPSCTVFKAEMLSDALGASIRPRRFNAWLFSAFGIAALAIVGSGILGLVAMTTGRRTKEIGIRMALGSTRVGVVRQILREQAGAVGVGLVAGGMAAAWAVKYVQAYLYKTPLYDVWSWGAAVGVILAVALLGALAPSLRASRVDPMRALRVE
jgi:predicted permease